jgi:hypothetical protein
LQGGPGAFGIVENIDKPRVPAKVGVQEFGAKAFVAGLAL